MLCTGLFVEERLSATRPERQLVCVHISEGCLLGGGLLRCIRTLVSPPAVRPAGQSAGCWGVYTQMLLPKSAGLYQRAICQSEGPGEQTSMSPRGGFACGDAMCGVDAGCDDVVMCD